MERCRNPFVNQVVCFLAKEIAGEMIRVSLSQSLRKSGRLFRGGLNLKRAGF